MTTPTRHKFWSDDFDMDLLKIFPQCAEMFAAAPQDPLYTYGGESFGRLNHPSVWNADGGLIAFFSLDPQVPEKPASFWTREKVRECTFEEAMRDAWPHTYRMLLGGKVIYDGPRWQPHFQTLMFDLRGWNKAAPLTIERVRSQVGNALLDAVFAFEEIVTKHAYEKYQSRS